LSWMVTGWAKGTSRDGKEQQAVRIQMMFTEFNLNDVLDMERQASGMYRREYHTWAREIGGHAEDSVTGERKELPPGRILDEHDGTYETNDEVTTIPPK
jgi:hypothetical protein